MDSIKPESTIHELITAFPFLITRLTESYPKLAALNNPIARAALAKSVTLSKAADMSGIPLTDLIGKITSFVKQEGGVDLLVSGLKGVGKAVADAGDSGAEGKA